MTTKKTDREIGDLFQPLKANVLETVKAQHAWQSTALKRLVRCCCVFLLYSRFAVFVTILEEC